MTGKTVEDLKVVRAELVERRRREAESLGGADDSGRLDKLVQLHQAIEALDAVIIASDLDVAAMVG